MPAHQGKSGTNPIDAKIKTRHIRGRCHFCKQPILKRKFGNIIVYSCNNKTITCPSFTAKGS